MSADAAVREPRSLGAVFPRGFLWGAATSAYQIEGATAEDGRGNSIWDRFCREPGRISDGTSGEVATDHYHRWRADVALMEELGLSGYRFSISWPRIQPEGSGRANAAGIAFYDRLVDRLCELNIAPIATLFHWDLPTRLEDRGGWLSRETSARFADYASLIAAALRDRVSAWITINEPYIHMRYGYMLGAHAPGHKLPAAALPVAHHLLLGHGLAISAIRSHSSSRVGITNHFSPTRPATEAADDVEANATYDDFHNHLFIDPILEGAYPARLERLPGGDLSQIRDDDLATIQAPIDFLGVNYYHPTITRAASSDAREPFEFVPIEGMPTTETGSPVVPRGLRDLLVGLRDRYGEGLPPILITENGCATDDRLAADDTCDDPDRIAFLAGHLRAVSEAIDAGVRVDGYFVWSLLDNFEWAEGYTKRYGIVYVDYPTQRRIWKSSAHWYRDVIAGWRDAAGT